MWADLMAEARSTGIHVPRRATRLEQAAVFEADGPVPPLAVSADARVFGPGDPALEDSEAYWREAGAARKALRGRMPWWKRVLTTADPSPLFTQHAAHAPDPERSGRRLSVRRARTA